MIPSGARPTKSDHRDHSYPRTFGSVLRTNFPLEFDTDAGLTMPDQMSSNTLFTPPVDALPMGCTGYTQSELCGDEDKTIYRPDYTYDQTLFIEGQQRGVGCDIRNSLKSTIIYGVERIDESKGVEEAVKHHRGQYFNVIDATELDSFDDIRSSVLLNQRPVSIGLPWFAPFEYVDETGMIPGVDYSAYVYRKWWFGLRMYAIDGTPWHNAKVAGWVERGGKPYLKVKSWQGKKYGDNGWCYFSREQVNFLMEIEGTAAFTLAKADPTNIENVKHTVLEFILSYLRNRVGLNV